MRTVLAVLALSLVAGPALAETPKTTPVEPRVYTPKPPPPPHKEGEYGGVTPGIRPANAPARPKRPPPKGTLTWIGFEAKDGGAQLFFQAMAPFEVTQHVVGGSVFAYLALPHLGQNTWRQVDTRYFDNPLSGVQAHLTRAAKASKTAPAHGAGIEVRITFKNPKDAKEASVRTATEADGMYYVYLAFPEGTDAAKTAAPTTIKDPEK